MSAYGSGCPVCLRQEATLRPIESAIPMRCDGTMENRDHKDHGYLVDCPACGEFVVTYSDNVNLRSARLRNKWRDFQVSALLREQTIRYLPRYWLRDGMDPYGPLETTDLAPINLTELLARWPRSVVERIDRTLCNLARLSPVAGHHLEIHGFENSITFAETPDEAQYNIRALVDTGMLENFNRVSGIYRDVSLTPNGWAHFDALTRGASAPENPVFVAMWFGDADERAVMDALFQKAIQPAIAKAGYNVTRVDRAEHNDWIMDKVLADIRLAPFVVADFTGNRNGVYFESGFARGLGTPVINTCRTDDFDKAHFDTKQLNHILWNTADELRERLYNRIINTVGLGPHAILSQLNSENP